jgi:queuine/archaeosine tRNA-ribosyltransferase
VLYRNASMQGQEIKQPIKQHMSIGNLEEASIKLLEKSIDKPQTSARENELLELFGIRVISDARVFLSDTTKSKCPTCLQDVLEEYRSETLLLIENILNRDVMTFQSELRGLLQKTIDKDDYSVYKELEQEAYCNSLSAPLMLRNK